MKRISLLLILCSIFFTTFGQIKIFNAKKDESKGDQLGVLIGKEIFMTDKNGVKGEKIGEFKDDGILYSVYKNIFTVSDYVVASSEVVDANNGESFEISKEGVIKSATNYIVVGFSDNIDIKAVGALLLLQSKLGLRE
jgi:hypothetical protein